MCPSESGSTRLSPATGAPGAEGVGNERAHPPFACSSSEAGWTRLSPARFVRVGEAVGNGGVLNQVASASELSFNNGTRMSGFEPRSRGTSDRTAYQTSRSIPRSWVRCSLLSYSCSRSVLVDGRRPRRPPPAARTYARLPCCGKAQLSLDVGLRRRRAGCRLPAASAASWRQTMERYPRRTLRACGA